MIFYSTLKEKARTSLQWNALGGITFQGLLTAHQIFLSRIMDGHLFGILGTTFSLIYLGTTILDAGLKDALAIFFKSSMRNKPQFLKKIILPVVAQCFIGMLALLGLSYLLNSTDIFPKSKIVFGAISMTFCITLMITEWINQILKMILQLNFKSKLVALWECIFIGSYLAITWGTYWHYGSFTLYTLLTPLLLCSVAGILFLSFNVLRIYQTLPTTQTHTNETYANDKKKSHIKHRLYLYINQLLKSVFSANFLVPFFAFTLGMHKGGIFKLASQVSFFILTLFKHTFGISSATVLAHLKGETLSTKTPIFYYFTKKMNGFFYGTILFIGANLFSLTSLGHDVMVSNFDYLAIALFLFLNLSDIVMIIYEKFFIIEEKIPYLLLANIASCGFMVAVLSFKSYYTYPVILTSLGLIRILYLLCMSFAAFKLWDLRPSFKTQPHIILPYVIATVVYLYINF